MNNISFILFYNLLLIAGYGINEKILNANILNNSSIKINLKHNYYYLSPILSAFFFGNVSLLLNFFIPLKYAIVILTPIYLYLLFAGKKFYLQDLRKPYFLITNILTPFIISFASYGIKFHYDAGAYHLNFQNWLNNYKITVGLANLNPYYSYGSIQEYFYANFYQYDFNLVISFFELLFFAALFNYLLMNLINPINKFLKTSSLFIFLFLFLDNFGYLGGGNGSIQIQMPGKPDTSVGILMLLVALLVLNDLKRNETDNFNFLLIITMSLFSFQLKSSAAFLILLLLIYIYRFKSVIKFFIWPNLMILLFFLMFILKNFLISGCLLYPLFSSCITKVPWINSELIYNSIDVTISDNFPYRIGDNFFEWWEFFFSFAYNKQIYINYLLSLFFIFIFQKLVFKNKGEKYNLIKFYFLIYLVFSFLIFFMTVPAFRNGYGIFISTVLLFAISDIQFQTRFKYFDSKAFFITLYIFTLLLIPRIFMYQEAIESNFSLVDFNEEPVVYMRYLNDFVIPTETNQCWTELNCLLLVSEKKYNYTKAVSNSYIIYKSN